jgi:iron complex transport system permease protein
MQTVFRNPLAGPYVLGISAGASLGVALLLLGSVVLGTGLHSGAWWVLVLAAIGGALALMVVVLWVSLRVQNNVSLLVLGVLFGGAVGSLVGLLQYFSTPLALKQFVLWTMGSLHGVDLEQLGWFLGMIAVGLVPVLFSIRSLNLMLLPDLDAQSLGLRLKVGRTWVLVSAGVLAGGVTGFVGPIGFVGLVAPHLARYALRTQNHRWLVPASALMGAMLLLAGDILSMLPGGGKVLPINSVTSLMGVPLVIFFWWKSRNVFQ